MKFNSAMLILVSCFLHMAQSTGHLRIDPELHPKSDEKFFGKDYPDDTQSKVAHKFSHPYPEIQDDSRYDKDYVKDENDDGGYWKVQMEYDRLKNAVNKERQDYKEALAKASQEESEYMKAKAAYDAAIGKESDLAAEEKEADSKHDKAGAELEVATKNVNQQVDEVEAEVKDLEDCKKQLIEAKAKLKELIGEKAAAEKQEAEKQAAEDEREVQEKEAEKKEKELEEKVQEETDEHEKALKSYKEEEEDVKKAEVDLAAAANKLRKYRRADPDGGVYRSGVTHARSMLSLLLLPMMLAMM